MNVSVLLWIHHCIHLNAIVFSGRRRTGRLIRAICQKFLLNLPSLALMAQLVKKYQTIKHCFQSNQSRGSLNSQPNFLHRFAVATAVTANIYRASHSVRPFNVFFLPEQHVYQHKHNFRIRQRI